MARGKKISFEEALTGLEAIVAELEDGDIALADLLDKYTQGVKFSEACLKEINAAEEAMDLVIQENAEGFEESALHIEGE
jgi:exodeoxyribonuclease VII small subunit